MSADRGATEVLGYVLVIALVTATIAVVMTTGISGLYDSQEAEQVNNMERAFDVLAHNVEETVHRGSPSRATEIRLADGSISYGDTVEINVTRNDEPIQNVTIETRPIIYDSGSGTQIVYEAGAVLRTEGDATTMLSPPPFVLEEDHILVNGIRTRPLSGSPESLDQKGTVLIRKEFLGSNIGSSTIGAGNTMNITIKSPRADAWASYFEEFEAAGIGELAVVEADHIVFVLDLDDDVKVSVIESRTRVTFAE